MPSSLSAPPALATAPLEPDAIARELGALASAFDLCVLPSCDSTNTRLMEAPEPDDGRVQVVAAEVQHAGRGRRGRQWQAWPGASLTFSTRWIFAKGAPVPAGLSLVAGLAVARTLEKLGLVGVQLKWPNDVLVLGSKLCGILTELQPSQGRPPIAVIGIGINMTLPAGTDIGGQNTVTSIDAHLAHPPDRNRLLALLLSELHGLLHTYGNAGFAALRGAWQQRNAFADLPVNILGETQALHGICVGVDDDGALLLRGDDGVTRILSGEVSLRPAS